MIAEILAVGHDGVIVGDAIEWTTVIVLADETHAIDLAVPLPANAELLPQAGTAVWDGGIVGFTFDTPVRTVVLRVREPLDLDDGLLAAPIIDTSAVQRLSLEGATFLPDPALGIERTLDDQRQPGISQEAECDVDQRLRVAQGRPPRHPVYFVADAAVRDAGLAGSLRRAGQVGGWVWFAALGVFALAGVGMAAAWRVLGRRAEQEDVDAYIRREFVGPPPG